MKSKLSLSAYIFEKAGDLKITEELCIVDIKKVCRQWAKNWWFDNPIEVEKIKDDFEMCTKLLFDKNKEFVFQSYADHYAEKLCALLMSESQIKRFDIVLDAKKLDEIRNTVNNRKKNVILASGHFGAVEMIPPLLSAEKIDNAAIYSFKSRRSQNLLQELVERTNGKMDIFNTNENFWPRFLNLRTQPKVLLTVVDAFDKWSRNSKSRKGVVFGKEFNLDVNFDRMAEILNADVYWSTILRQSNSGYKWEFKKIVPQGKDRHLKELMKEWERNIDKNPFNFFGWDHIDFLFEKD